MSRKRKLHYEEDIEINEPDYNGEEYEEYEEIPNDTGGFIW